MKKEQLASVFLCIGWGERGGSIVRGLLWNPFYMKGFSAVADVIEDRKREE